MITILLPCAPWKFFGSQKQASTNGHHFPGRRRVFAAGASACLVLFAGFAAAATVSPTSVSWASVSVGGIGAQKTVTLNNSSGSAITISSISITGADPEDFDIFSKSCSSSLAANASCTANITFTPKASGTRTATLDFNDSASPSPQTAALSGYAPGGSSAGSGTASVSPTSLSWASVTVGGIGAQKAATLTNSGSTSISISSVTLTGANPGDYRIYSNTCTGTLAAGGSCSAKVAFAPTTGGTRTASLAFNDSASNSPQSVALSGFAPGGSSGGSVTVSPTQLNFPTTAVGSSSAAQTATLSNGTTASITISSVAIG